MDDEQLLFLLSDQQLAFCAAKMADVRHVSREVAEAAVLHYRSTHDDADELYALPERIARYADTVTGNERDFRGESHDWVAIPAPDPRGNRVLGKAEVQAAKRAGQQL